MHVQHHFMTSLEGGILQAFAIVHLCSICMYPSFEAASTGYISSLHNSVFAVQSLHKRRPGQSICNLHVQQNQQGNSPAELLAPAVGDQASTHLSLDMPTTT